MKNIKYFVLTILFVVHANFYSYTQNNDKNRNAHHFIEYIQNDLVGVTLDYSNTICDTLFYNGQIILLETSPLLKVKGINMLSEPYTPLKDSIYNCARGYTANWKLENNKLFLITVNLHGNTNNKTKSIIKHIKNILNVNANWFSGKILGGSDAVKTNYGYAFKQRFEFEIYRGTLVNQICEKFPVGTLEDENSLNKFLNENSNALLDVFLHLDKFDTFRNEKTNRTDKKGLLRRKISLITTSEGETYFSSDSLAQGITIGFLSKNKDLFERLLVADINFANMLPKGSFYPRFLRNNIIYKPICIDFLWNIYGDIYETKLLNYALESNN
jgi:hypothetical protein